MANSADPDQTAPLFAQTSLSENLGSLQYLIILRLAFVAGRAMSGLVRNMEEKLNIVVA